MPKTITARYQGLDFPSLYQVLKNDSFDWQFKTFNDPILVKLLAMVKTWCAIPNKEKTIFTISGPTEVGKTHLLKRAYRLFQETHSTYPKKKYGYKSELYIAWSKVNSLAFEKHADLLDDIEHAGIVFIEDFLSGNMRDDNAFTRKVIEIAYTVINSRVGKPTMIDTNRSIDEIDSLDSRISSRLFRERNKEGTNGAFFDIPENTTKFLMR